MCTRDDDDLMIRDVFDSDLQIDDRNDRLWNLGLMVLNGLDNS